MSLYGFGLGLSGIDSRQPGPIVGVVWRRGCVGRGRPALVFLSGNGIVHRPSRDVSGIRRDMDVASTAAVGPRRSGPAFIDLSARLQKVTGLATQDSRTCLVIRSRNRVSRMPNASRPQSHAAGVENPEMQPSVRGAGRVESGGSILFLLECHSPQTGGATTFASTTKLQKRQTGRRIRGVRG